MPNIGGVFTQQRNADAREKNKLQMQRLAIRGVEYSHHHFDCDGYSIGLLDHGILNNPGQPAHSADGQRTLLMDGEVYNTAELRRNYRDELQSDTLSDGQLYLALIEKYGNTILTEFNGFFIFVIYNKQRHSLTIAGDRPGFRPLYYVQRGTSLLFGSEIKALAAADQMPRTFDELGVLELFSYGHHFEERTSFSGYTKLAPATVLTFENGELHTHRYWNYQYDETAQHLDQASYYTVFRNLMDRSVERCMQSNQRIGTFLSGGYDSRVVAASIRKHHLPITSVTFGVPESRDVKYAGLLAERLGFYHMHLSNKDAYLYNHCHQIVWRTEGMLPFAGTTSIQFHNELKQHMDIILTGVLSEFSGSHTWPGLLLARTREKTIAEIFQRFVSRRSHFIKPLFNQDFYRRNFEQLESAFRASFEKVHDNHPLNIADSWNVMNIQPRTTYHASSADRHKFEIRAPHMDAELTDFLLTIPPTARIEQRVYKKMIAYGYPEIRDIPCTNSARPIDPVFMREYAKMVADFMGRKVSSSVKRIIGAEEGLGREIMDLGAQLRHEKNILDEYLMPMLENGIFPDEIFSDKGIKETVDAHLNRRADHSLLIALLISWGLSTKWFMYEQLEDAPNELYIPQ